MNPLLEESGVESSDSELIVKPQFFHDRHEPASLSTDPRRRWLFSRNSADELVDLHGPHDSPIALVARGGSFALLDGYAHTGDALRISAYRKLQSLRAEHASLSTAESAREQEIDLLRHQVNEITNASLTTGEEEGFHALPVLRATRNGSRIGRRDFAKTFRNRRRDPAQLAETQRLLRDLEKNRSGKIDAGGSTCGLRHGVSEISHALGQYAEQLDLDPAQLRRARRTRDTL